MSRNVGVQKHFVLRRREPGAPGLRSFGERGLPTSTRALASAVCRAGVVGRRKHGFGVTLGVGTKHFSRQERDQTRPHGCTAREARKRFYPFSTKKKLRAAGAPGRDAEQPCRSSVQQPKSKMRLLHPEIGIEIVSRPTGTRSNEAREGGAAVRWGTVGLARLATARPAPLATLDRAATSACWPVRHGA